LFQRSEELNINDKKLLQTIFGENLLVSNQIREKMVNYKDLIVFLLNSVVLKMLEFMHRSERRASQIKLNNQRNTLVSIPDEEYHLGYKDDMDSNLDSQRQS